MTDQERFLQWHQEEVDNGLVDIKFFMGDLSDITTGGFYREATVLNDAEGIEMDTYKDTVERTNGSDRFKLAGYID